MKYFLSLLSVFLLTLSVNVSAQEAEGEASAEAGTAEAASNEENNQQGDDVANPLENIIVMALKEGPIYIKLMPEAAPNHVSRIKELTRQGFYNGVPFHRVIDGFMAQTGDPTGTGTGGSGQKIDAEFNNEKHLRGTVSMARAADPNSADSQFFIVFDEAPHLDRNYTAFGQVIEGMELVDAIKKGVGPNGMVSDPDKIVEMFVAADREGTEVPGVNADAQAATDATEEGAEGEANDNAEATESDTAAQ